MWSWLASNWDKLLAFVGAVGGGLFVFYRKVVGIDERVNAHLESEGDLRRSVETTQRAVDEMKMTLARQDLALAKQEVVDVVMTNDIRDLKGDVREIRQDIKKLLER